MADAGIRICLDIDFVVRSSGGGGGGGGGWSMIAGGVGLRDGGKDRILYVMTRFYISQYEYWVTWRGRREALRRKLRSTITYNDWKSAAKELDTYLGADAWKTDEAFAYYDYKTIRKAAGDMRKLRERAEEERLKGHLEVNGGGSTRGKAVDELRILVELCVKNNFGGIESFRLYSQTYYGTKEKVQGFIEEGRCSDHGSFRPSSSDLVLCSREKSEISPRDEFIEDRR